MISRTSIWLLIFVTHCTLALAQNPLVLKSGRIEYERKINAFALMKAVSDAGAIPLENVQNYTKQKEQFKVDRFMLYFNENKSLYKPLKSQPPAEISMDEWFAMVADQNEVYTDLRKNQCITEKSIFNSEYIITDSLMRIKWKWTSEIREIAGFTCRRANGLLLDSVYVVAFFASDITPSGGPEEFHGLPGMILGAVIPQLHVSWFATKVIVDAVPEKALEPPSGGKKMDRTQYKQALDELMRNWGEAGKIIFAKAFF
jgi:GLPGLI family protein